MPFKSQNLKIRSRKLKNNVFITIVVTIALYLLPFTLQAQCAMCRASLQGEEAQAQAEGINNGIIFLMVVPYVLVAAAGFAIYKIMYGKKSEKSIVKTN